MSVQPHEHDRWASEPIAPTAIPSVLRRAIVKATALRAWRKLNENGGRLASLNNDEIAALAEVIKERIATEEREAWEARRSA